MHAKAPVNEVISQLAYLSTTDKPQQQASDQHKASVVDTTQEPAKNVSPPSPFAEQSLENVCSAQAGAQVLFATDEWFASADNLLQDGPPLFDPDLYCNEGKVMDGWETRRRREAGHDWCLIKLSKRASICGIELDTAHFTGNHVPHLSIEIADLRSSKEATMVAGIPGVMDRLLHRGCMIQGTGHTPEEVHQAEDACRTQEWKELLPMTSLSPGYEPSRMHYFTLPESVVGTHVRVNYYPDGGVARMRLWSAPAQESTKTKKPMYSPIKTGKICTVVSHTSTDTPPSQQQQQPLDNYKELSAAENGGVGIGCSNKHYGDPSLLIQSTLGKDMGDGWETARHPERPTILVRDPDTNLVDSPLCDWAILKLGSPAIDGVRRVILDTKHFRGNYPESVLVEGCFAERGVSDDLVCSSDQVVVEWFPLVKRVRMAPDSEHVFDASIQQIVNATRAVTHVRVTIYPDGGLSRVRIYGASQDKEDESSSMRSHL